MAMDNRSPPAVPTDLPALTGSLDDELQVSLRVVLAGSRLGHQIRVGPAGSETQQLLLESVETAEDPPPGPPLQNWHHESRATGDVLLGVGQAGRNHWSASVEAPRGNGPVALEFQLACRINQPVSWLGSGYRFHQPSADDLWQFDEAALSENENTADSDHAPDSLIWQGDAGTAIRLVPLPPASLVLDSGIAGIRIEAGVPDQASPPLTIQWQYRIEWA